MSSQDNLKSGERRNVTVLFSDMKGFTSLSERLDPEEVDVLMTRIFSVFESIIQRYEGTVEKYIGDALVAVFGFPRIHEDDPARAVNAALDFLKEIGRENQELQGKDISLSFRSGIHTGLITTGKRGKFDVVTGHTMSVAARLESQAPQNSIYVSETTREKCENDFLFSDPVSLQVKGKEDLIHAYLVQGRNMNLLRSREPFVGRKSILDQMLRCYLKHDVELAGASFLTGEAGIGKTRLAGKFIERITEFPGFSAAVLSARAQRYRPLQFAVVIDLLADYYQLDVYDTPERIAEQLSSREGIDRETAKGFSRIISSDSHSRIVDRAYLVLYSLLESICNKSSGPYPPLIYIDDVHNLDKSSRDFFQYYLRQAGMKPFFLFTGREIPQSLKEVFVEFSTQELAPLSREESLEYINLLSPETFDEETINTILTGSFGNPLFIREYVKFMKVSGDTSALPMTIQNVFLMTLDKYPQERRDLLKKLSIFILSFTVEDVRYIELRTEGNPDGVPETLDLFRSEGILGQEGQNYFFRYDVFKKALYTSILNYNKRILHRIVASRLMEKGNPHLPRLLQHLIKAEDYAQARKMLLEEPARVFSMEYLRYLDIILEHTSRDDYPAIIECLFTKSAILFNNGKMEAVDSILKQILRIAISQRNFEYSANAYHLLAAYNLNSYSFQKAYFCGTKALDFYGKTESVRRSAQDVLRILSLSELLRNNRSGSSDFLERMNDELNGTENMIKRDAYLEHYLLTGSFQDALKYLPKDDPEVSDRLQDSWLYSRFPVTKLLWQLCSFGELKEVIRKMLKIGTRHYSILSQIQAQYAVCSIFEGENDGAAGCFHQAEFYLSQIRNDFDLIDAQRTLSLAYALAGNQKRAEEIACEGIAVGFRHSSYYPVFSMLILLVELALHQGRNDDAGFIMAEADFYVRLDPLLSRKDLILYHYFAYRLGNDSAMAFRAASLLEEEKANIKHPELIRNFLGTRMFAEVETLGKSIKT